MESVKVGAVGKQGEHQWDHKGRTQIVQIVVSHNTYSIKSLQFQYLENGQVRPSEVIGCCNLSGGNFNTITLQGSSEFITKVEGIKDDYGEFRKLSIHTNIKVYEIFEAVSVRSMNYDKRFSFNFGGLNQFGGFHGTTHDTYSSYGEGVSSIGVYFNCLTAPPAGYFLPSNATGLRSIYKP